MATLHVKGIETIEALQGVFQCAKSLGLMDSQRVQVSFVNCRGEAIDCLNRRAALLYGKTSIAKEFQSHLVDWLNGTSSQQLNIEIL